MKTYYNINVSRTTFALAAALLDALATAGLASTVLALTGTTKQSVARLDPATGEYCNFVHAAKLKDENLSVSPAAVQGMIAGKPCPFLALDCRLRREGNCAASLGEVEEVFEALHQKGALDKGGGGWSVPL